MDKTSYIYKKIEIKDVENFSRVKHKIEFVGRLKIIKIIWRILLFIYHSTKILYLFLINYYIL